MTLEEIHARLAAALEPLGIEVGPEVLALWLDRRTRGREALPAAAVIRLARIADELLVDAGRARNGCTQRGAS